MNKYNDENQDGEPEAPSTGGVGNYFLWGAGLFILGLIIFFYGVAPTLFDGDSSGDLRYAFFFSGLAIMFLGPFVFWVVIPIIAVVRRYHGRDGL